MISIDWLGITESDCVLNDTIDDAFKQLTIITLKTPEILMLSASLMLQL